MSDTEMHPGDVERNAKLLGLRLAAGHGQPIASMISEIRRNVARKASALQQDAPLAVYFDAR
jgi:ribosomal protein L29